LQNENAIVDTNAKTDLICRLIDAGARRIEVASFVDPRRVPQMADGDAVIAALPDRNDVSYIGLCLNLRGVERAIMSRAHGACGVDEARCVLVATDTFGIRN
jgi:hydroxymethylglutaryl-CoA lyase